VPTKIAHVPKIAWKTAPFVAKAVPPARLTAVPMTDARMKPASVHAPAAAMNQKTRFSDKGFISV